MTGKTRLGLGGERERCVGRGKTPLFWKVIWGSWEENKKRTKGEGGWGGGGGVMGFLNIKSTSK